MKRSSQMIVTLKACDSLSLEFWKGLRIFTSYTESVYYEFLHDWISLISCVCFFVDLHQLEMVFNIQQQKSFRRRRSIALACITLQQLEDRCWQLEVYNFFNHIKVWVLVLPYLNYMGLFKLLRGSATLKRSFSKNTYSCSDIHISQSVVR